MGSEHHERPAGARTASRRRAALALAVASGLLVALAPADGDAGEDELDGWPLEEPRPVDDGVPAEVEGWRDMSCARCHETIAREWAGTRHALAWIDPHYTKELSKMRRPESCHACHVPEALHVPVEGAEEGALEVVARPEARERRRHHGVDCRACHAGPDGSVLGPWGAETYAHVSVRSESFTEEGASRLCITCHDTHIGPVVGLAKDFLATGQVEKGLSCVGCHMAPVERPAADDPDEDEPSPVRVGRSHALQTPRDPSFLRRAFALSAAHEAGGTVVRVENRCGHRVPGLAGREIELLVTGFDARRGKREEASFVLTRDAYLPVDEPLEIRLELEAASLQVRGIHRAPGFAEPVEFLALELVPHR